jgi:hypothetical protein
VLFLHRHAPILEHVPVLAAVHDFPPRRAAP